MMEAGSAVRMEVALRVLAAHCDLGRTATPEDEENVRRWAGDQALAPPEAAIVVIRRELGRDLVAGSSQMSERFGVWPADGSSAHLAD